MNVQILSLPVEQVRPFPQPWLHSIAHQVQPVMPLSYLHVND